MLPTNDDGQALPLKFALSPLHPPKKNNILTAIIMRYANSLAPPPFAKNCGWLRACSCVSDVGHGWVVGLGGIGLQK